MFTFEHIVIAALTNINSPVICIVFQQPIKTAPRTDLSRVARFVKPCAVRNEDSRYEIVLSIASYSFYLFIKFAEVLISKGKADAYK